MQHSLNNMETVIIKGVAYRVSKEDKINLLSSFQSSLCDVASKGVGLTDLASHATSHNEEEVVVKTEENSTPFSKSRRARK